jgi:hypothetical protein
MDLELYSSPGILELSAEGEGSETDIDMAVRGPRGRRGEKGEKGDKGEDGGAEVSVRDGWFYMSISDDGHLLLTSNAGETLPPLEIDYTTGHLVYSIEI